MRPVPFRRAWVLAHRYAGLLLAGFLILEGVTGSLLAFETPIARWLAPWSFARAHPGAAPLALGVLAERLEQAEPRARPGFFSVDGRQAVFSVLPRIDPSTGRPYRLGFDHVVLDPWTGRELARRRDGDLSQGPINFVPFLYRLHQNLAVGGWGTILLGLVAVLWTLDCFVAVALTLPVSWMRFLGRWTKAWRVKWPASGFRLTYDLHRAGGLWLWPALLVFAWSSVMLTLPDQVYAPVTGALLDYRSDAAVFSAMSQRSAEPSPRIGWVQAEAIGQGFMARAAAERGFRIERPYGMAYIAQWGVYTYAVVSDRNVEAHGWDTSLWLDGDSGQLVELDVPGAQPAGNTVDLWLRALHFGDLRDSGLYRVAVFALGALIAGLSVTGVLVLLRKHRAEGSKRAGRRAPAPAGVDITPSRGLEAPRSAATKGRDDHPRNRSNRR